jgi:hypothetical protein
VKNDEKGVPALKPQRHQHQIEVEPVVQNKPLARTKRRRWRKTKVKSTVLVISESLYDLNMVGIDTCSAVSVSTERGDFPLYLDETTETKDSVVLNGVGGANASIGGRGPLVVRAKDSEGNDLVVFDPAGVYLDCGASEGDQARFRIFGQMKLKDAGLSLVQDKRGDGTDYLCYRGEELEIPLESSDGILTLRAGEANLTKEQMAGLDKHIDTINVRSDGRAFVKLD